MMLLQYVVVLTSPWGGSSSDVGGTRASRSCAGNGGGHLWMGVRGYAMIFALLVRS